MKTVAGPAGGHYSWYSPCWWMYSMTGSGTIYRRERSLLRISRTFVLETSFCDGELAYISVGRNCRSAGKRTTTYGYNLGDDMDVVLVVLQARQRLVNVCARPLDDKGTKIVQYVIQILGRPHTRGAHGLDKVCSCQQGDVHWLLVPVDILASSDNMVDLVVEVVEHLGGGNVVGLYSLPGVAGQPLGGLLGGEGTHLNSVPGGSKARLLVGIGDRGEEAANDLVLCVEARVVRGHLEHAQVEVGDGAVGGEFVSKAPNIAPLARGGFEGRRIRT